MTGVDRPRGGMNQHLWFSRGRQGPRKEREEEKRLRVSAFRFEGTLKIRHQGWTEKRTVWNSPSG